MTIGVVLTRDRSELMRLENLPRNRFLIGIFLPLHIPTTACYDARLTAVASTYPDQPCFSSANSRIGGVPLYDSSFVTSVMSVAA